MVVSNLFLNVKGPAALTIPIWLMAYIYCSSPLKHKIYVDSSMAWEFWLVASVLLWRY